MPKGGLTIQRSDEPPHVCYEGLVYVGHMTEADGEESNASTFYVPQLWYLEGWESMLCA